MLHLPYLDAPQSTPRYCFVKWRVEAAGRRDILGFASGLVFASWQGDFYAPEATAPG